MKSRGWVELDHIKANQTVVFDLMEHLKSAFEDFCNTYHAEVPYIDAFMGVHNFHKLIVRDIVLRGKDWSDEQRIVFYQMAAGTFERGMEKEIKKIEAAGTHHAD